MAGTSAKVASSYVVHDKNGRLSFPETIAKPRTKMTNYIMVILVLLCFLNILYYEGCIKLHIEASCYAILVVYLVEMIYRFVLTCEEFFYHIKPRYENDLGRLLEHTLYLTNRSKVVLIFSAMTVLCFFMDHGWIDTSKLCTQSYLNISVLVLMLKKIINVENAPIYDSLRFEEENGLCYSSAMAHSFYHGYLRLILPNNGGEDKNLNEIIGIYSDRNNVKVYPKLFILVPKSANCPTTLKGPNIIESQSLDKKELSIAAVQKRVYKNSVYKIRDSENRQKYHYVCTEYATPLKTFSDALNASGRCNENFKKHKEDIVLHFYLIVRELIRNDPQICDFCEMIYFDDKDAEGNTRDVSHLLLKKVKQT